MKLAGFRFGWHHLVFFAFPKGSGERVHLTVSRPVKHPAPNVSREISNGQSHHHMQPVYHHRPTAHRVSAS